MPLPNIGPLTGEFVALVHTFRRIDFKTHQTRNDGLRPMAAFSICRRID
jgi:hypothetical protein